MRHLISSILTTSLVLVAGTYAAGLTPDTPIRRVTCRGATHLTEDGLYRWLRHNLPERMLAAEPDELRRQLRARFPFDAVAVERRWPSELHIRVEERKPYAMAISTDGRISLVDHDGRLVTRRHDQRIAVWDRPVIRGCPPPTHPHDAQRCVRRGVGFLAWLDAEEPGWIDELSEIIVDGQFVTVHLLDGMRIAFGESPYRPKLAALDYAWGLASRRGLRPRGLLLMDNRQVILQTPRSQSARAGLRAPDSERREDEA